MFSRFVPVLSSMGAKVLFKPQSALEQLFKDSHFPAEFIHKSASFEMLNFDTHISLMSLPLLLKINAADDIPFKDKYLKANPEKVAKYKEKYFNTDDFKIGLVWQCKNIYRRDSLRSVHDISLLYPIIRIPGVKVYSIQKGLGEAQLKNLPEDIEIEDLGGTFKDFTDTAAAIENLDLMISVDTSVAHLSGALGKETLLLLDYTSEWRWQLDRTDSIWYDKVRLFRQKRLNNWQDAINEAFEFIIQKYGSCF